MFCTSCGKENAEGARFCNQCGAPLVVPTQPQPETDNASIQAQTQAAEQPGSQQQTAAQPNAQQETASAPVPPPPPGQQQDTYQQNGYQQPCTQPQPSYAPAAGVATYPMTSQDETLRLINFILCVISCVASCWLLVPLAWMIPMTVHSWGIYKGTKPNTTAFGVCTLIFLNVIGGILLLVSNRDR